MDSNCQINCKCKRCKAKAHNKKYYDKNRDKINRNRKPLTEEQKKKDNHRRRERIKKFGRPKGKGVPYHVRNSEKNAINAKIWREKNKDRIKQKRKERTQRLKTSDPGWVVLQRIKVSGLQVFNKRRHIKALLYTGSASHEDFIIKMTNKTDEKNWVLLGYQLDHIVQQNWIREFAEKNQDNPDFIGCVINNHSNLRPIPATENNRRSKWDVSVFEKLARYDEWEPFLNKKLKAVYDFYLLNKNRFSDGQINRGSPEEKIILSYLRSFF